MSFVETCMRIQCDEILVKKGAVLIRKTIFTALVGFKGYMRCIDLLRYDPNYERRGPNVHTKDQLIMRRHSIYVTKAQK